jgi:YVTN family beta-propeller protein
LREAARIPVGQTPWNVAFLADGSSAYVTNSGDDTVSVIDTTNRSVSDVIALGTGTLESKNSSGVEVSFSVGNHIPTAVALGPDGNIWVACNVPGTLPVIDPSTNAVIQTIGIGIGDVPTGIAFIS